MSYFPLKSILNKMIQQAYFAFQTGHVEHTIGMNIDDMF